jgi:hypothetical protein
VCERTEENEWTEVKVAVRPPVCTYTYIFSFGTHIAVYGGASITGHSVQKELWLFDTIAQTYGPARPNTHPTRTTHATQHDTRRKLRF